MRAAILVLALVVAGCVTPARYVANPYPPPPLPQAEAIPRPPVTEATLTWEPGHWNWVGQGYAWTPGRYVDRHGLATLYQPGYWTNARGPWEWVPPHWL